MASPYVTGPAFFWIGSTQSVVPLFLGTCELAPAIHLIPEFEGFLNAVTGVKIPHDVTFQGEHGLVLGEFNRYNENTLDSMQRRVSELEARGSFAFGDLGTLMIGEGGAFPLWVQFPYHAKTAFAAAGMPAGYRFPTAYLMGPDRLESLGLVPRKNILVWHALPTYNAATKATFLYDHDMTQLDGLTPN